MKQLTFSYKDTEYTLEFTRKSIAALEQTGFDIEHAKTKPATFLPALFRGAFLSQHPRIREALVDEIFDHMTDRNALYDRLSEMYGDGLASLVNEPEDGEGNVKWESNW
jgi:hypothetical protein